ncbi:MAG: DnaJ C-terminal domain-containing protein [Solidesulfovibrio sp. DCME]|uniref:DnaJ C-terminal domain-containing protein n=1 Tax=Solidesulfovibrio sp. DCME TaxID=3447380 RepID=UPI003D0E35A9
MSVEYKDYYKLLGVSKTAGQEEISKAFKKLARKHHPDLNPNDPEAEKKFKEFNEAYEVLKDPEKRKLYDSLGPNWQHGQNFQRPSGFEGGGYSFNGQQFDAGAFSDFFETIFGGAGGGRTRYERGGNFSDLGGGFGGFGGFGGGGGYAPGPTRGSDANATLELTLEEAYKGGAKAITLQEQAIGPDGSPRLGTKTLNVNIPAGVREGGKIRLSGQGNPGRAGGKAGDLYLKVKILPHALFKLEEGNVILDLPLAPWEAALGAKVRVPTLDGAVEMHIPAGSSSGRKLRLSGKGLGGQGKRGDQLVRLMVQVPAGVTDAQRELWEQLAAASTDFSPRSF